MCDLTRHFVTAYFSLMCALTGMASELPKTVGFALKPPFMGIVAITEVTSKSQSLSDSVLTAAGRDGIVDHLVLKISWADLEPLEGDFVPGFALIDRCLEQAERNHLYFNLRVLAGRWAPDWLKAQAGTVRMNNVYDHIEAEVVRWWKPEVGSAYRRLHQTLAARYDSNPHLKVVTMTRGMTIWPEPMQKELRDPATRARLWEAGYRTELDRQCDRETLRVHAECWRQTYSSISINPYQVLDPKSKEGWRRDVTMSMDLIEEAVRFLGPRALIQNSSLRMPVAALGPDMLKIYDRLRLLTTQTALQTDQFQRIGSPRQCLEYAVELKAGAVEVDRIFQLLSSKPTLRSASDESAAQFDRRGYVIIDQELEANAREKFDAMNRSIN